MAAAANDYSPIYTRLCGEFLENARETLDGMAALYRATQAGSADPEPAFQAFLRSLHNLKGLGGTFGFHSLSVISHLLEDRLRWLPANEFGGCFEILSYLDAMSKIVDDGMEPDATRLRDILSQLARDTASRAGDAARKSVVIVSGSGTMRELVHHGLTQAGFRGVTYANPYEALSYIVRSRPDAVVCTAELVGLSGFDLVHALRAMPATEGTRVALLTSHGPDHPRVRSLPRTASFVQVGPDMFVRLEAVLADAEVRAFV